MPSHDPSRPVAASRMESFPRGTRLATAIGAGVTLLIMAVFLSHQRLGFAARQYSTNFYDAQARSWLAGNWNIDLDVVQIEGVLTAHGYQMYFGPFPALLRLPILVLTRRFDGFLAQPSMTLAAVVFVGSVAALWWQIRFLVRGHVPVARAEKVAGALAIVMAGVGSMYLTVLSSIMVYSEAIAWGVALTLLSFALLLPALHRYHHRLAIAACAAAGVAVSSRLTVGAGALLAMWMVAGLWTASRIAHDRSDRPSMLVRRLTGSCAPTLNNRRPPLSEVLVWLTGAASGTVAYAIVNYVRFSQFFSVPWTDYHYNQHSARRLAVLAANDGELTGLRFVPTTLWHYLRPDALMFDDRIPWINFPRRSAIPVGDVVLDVDSPSSSFSAVMPLFVVLALITIVVLFRRRGRGATGLLSVPLLGSALACGGMLMSAFLAHRYMADALPFLVMSAFTGFFLLFTSLRGRRMRTGAAAVALGAMTWGLLVNVALSVEYQKLVFPNSGSSRYEFVRLQHSSGGDAHVKKAVTVPEPDVRGTLLIVDECQALLWSTGETWIVLEGRVLPENWLPEPEDRFFDLDIEPPGRFRPPVLCQELLVRQGD